MRPTHHLRRLLAAAGLAAAMATATPVMAQDGPRFGGTFVAAIAGEPGGLNPVLFQGAEPQIAAAPMFDPLIQLDMVGNPRGVLAESWTVSDDRTTVTFTLREGVRWHDGKPLTSADVLWTFMGTRDGYMPHPRYRSTLDVLVDRYEAPDPRSFTITLKQPYAPFLRVFAAANYAMPIVPKHVYEGTDIPNNPANWAPVGSGPFKFREWVRGSHIELVRNEDYFIPDQPRVDSVFIRIMPDETARLLALRQGEVDYLYYYAVAYSAIPALQADPAITVTSDGAGLQGLVQLLALNIAQPPFDDVRVRRALAHLIDRELINRLVYFGLARPTVSNIGITTPFWTEEVQQRHDLGSAEANLAEAERLLDEAGYPRGADGTRFSLRLRPAPWFQMTRATGDYVRQALQQVGIAVELVTADSGAHSVAVYTDHDFDLAIGSPVWRNDPAISTTILFQGGLPAGVPFSNQYGYDDPEMNALIAAAAAELDRDRRVALYHDFQRKAATDLPIIHLVDFTFITVARDEVKGVASNPRWATSSWADTWVAR